MLESSPGVEHLSMTVGDFDAATAFFTDVFGCRLMYTMGPFGRSDEPFMRIYANADVRSVVHRVRVLRSPFLNIELFDVTSPRQRPVWPDLHDIGGWCLTASVRQLEPAVDFLRAQDLFILGVDGQAVRAMTPWGLLFEVRSGAPDLEGRWDPSRAAPSGFAPGPPCLPGFLGFGGLTTTVADLDAASRFCERVLGLAPVGDTKPASRDAYRAWANVDVRATPTRGRMLRSPNLNLELVECPPYPGQNRDWPLMFDVGGWHLAFYVDGMEAEYDRLLGEDVHVLGPMKPAYLFEAGEGAYTVHAMAPFGLSFEMVTYPSGRYRQSEYAAPAWHPGRVTS
jgi:catechol 2,3-dioxygenase-like lactoylglutathione lyase family enzyme